MADSLKPTIGLVEYLDQRFNTLETKLDKVNGTIATNHDICVAYREWKVEHEKTHARERGILASLSVIGTAAAAVLAWFK